MGRIEEIKKVNPQNVLPKLALACPTYGYIDPRAAKSVRVAIMDSRLRGVEWVGDVSPDRMGWEASRNIAAKSALEGGAEGIIWFDSDMIVPPDSIYRLVSHGLDFTSGMYFQRAFPHFPLAATYDPKVDSFRWLVSWPDQSVLFQVDGVGFGCVYTSAALLRSMLDLKEVKDHGWFRKTKFSEDLNFCVYAAKVGVKPHVDSAIMCGHLGEPKECGKEDFAVALASGAIENTVTRIVGTKKLKNETK
jgi:hypothetical protein